TIRVDLLGGIRYLDLQGSLFFNRQTTFAADLTSFPTFQPLAGTRVEQSVNISVRNQFFGGQVGLGFQFFWCGTAYFGSDFRLGVGGNHQSVQIAGQLSAVPDRTAIVGGGPFPANSGSFTRDRLAYVPELNVYLGLPVCANVTVRGGYTLLYW